MYSEATLRREMKLLKEMLSEATRANDREREDWIYGAICGLSWAINDPDNQTMKPSKAFTRELMRKIG